MKNKTLVKKDNNEIKINTYVQKEEILILIRKSCEGIIC